MRIVSFCLHPAALTALAWATVVHALAQPPVPLLSDLARAWSGGATTATCHDAPDMAEIPAAFRFQNCVWPRVTHGREFGQVTGSRAPGDRLHRLTWERAVADSGAAARLADSLGTALRARGLTEYACPDAGRRWQRAGLIVQYTRGVVHGDRLLHVAVFATTLPNTIPAFVCPKAPGLPGPPGPAGAARHASDAGGAADPVRIRLAGSVSGGARTS